MTRNPARASVVLAVALLVLTAGCSGMTGSEATPVNDSVGDSTAASVTATSDTAASNATTAATPSGATSDAAAGSSTTSTASESEASGANSSADADDATAKGGANESADDTATETALRGQMTVVVAGDELDRAGVGNESAGFWFASDGNTRRWYATQASNETLSEALATLGVEASADEVTHEGETYAESDDGVSLNYRVNGDPVDPESYTLENGDEIWVTIETPDMDADVPGDHIRHEVSHIHGDIEFVVEGKSLDFSSERYQSQSHSQYFHFEGGNADPWHAHSYSVTLEYAMGTLKGVSVAQNRVTYDGTTYEGSDEGTTVTIEANGEAVNPETYFLKDGDDVTIVVETDE